MGDVTSSEDLPLWSDYPAFARRHRLALSTFVVLGLLAGLGWSMQQPSAYSATASVALAPVPVYVISTPDELVPPEVSIDTDAQLLGSDLVLGAIAEALGVDRVTAAERLSVRASANSHVLHVTVTASSPLLAAEAANAAVGGLATARTRTLGSLQEHQARHLRAIVGGHGGELAETDDLLLSADSDDLGRILSARASLDELEESRAAPVDVVRPAVAPQRGDYANTEVPIVSGATVGLLLGCAFGAGRDRLRAAHRTARVPAGAAAQRHRSTGAIDQEDHHHAT